MMGSRGPTTQKRASGQRLRDLDPYIQDIIKSDIQFRRASGDTFIPGWAVAWANKQAKSGSKPGSGAEDLAYYAFHPLLRRAAQMTGIAVCDEAFPCGLTSCIVCGFLATENETDRCKPVSWFVGRYAYKAGCKAFDMLDNYDAANGPLFNEVGPRVHTAYVEQAARHWIECQEKSHAFFTEGWKKLDAKLYLSKIDRVDYCEENFNFLATYEPSLRWFAEESAPTPKEDATIVIEAVSAPKAEAVKAVPVPMDISEPVSVLEQAVNTSSSSSGEEEGWTTVSKKTKANKGKAVPSQSSIKKTKARGAKIIKSQTYESKAYKAVAPPAPKEKKYKPVETMVFKPSSQCVITPAPLTSDKTSTVLVTPLPTKKNEVIKTDNKPTFTENTGIKVEKAKFFDKSRAEYVEEEHELVEEQMDDLIADRVDQPGQYEILTRVKIAVLEEYKQYPTTPVGWALEYMYDFIELEYTLKDLPSLLKSYRNAMKQHGKENKAPVDDLVRGLGGCSIVEETTGSLASRVDWNDLVVKYENNNMKVDYDYRRFQGDMSGLGYCAFEAKEKESTSMAIDIPNKASWMKAAGFVKAGYIVSDEKEIVKTLPELEAPIQNAPIEVVKDNPLPELMPMETDSTPEASISEALFNVGAAKVVSSCPNSKCIVGSLPVPTSVSASGWGVAEPAPIFSEENFPSLNGKLNQIQHSEMQVENANTPVPIFFGSLPSQLQFAVEPTIEVPLPKELNVDVNMLLSDIEKDILSNVMSMEEAEYRGLVEEIVLDTVENCSRLEEEEKYKIQIEKSVCDIVTNMALGEELFGLKEVLPPSPKSPSTRGSKPIKSSPNTEKERPDPSEGAAASPIAEVPSDKAESAPKVVAKVAKSPVQKIEATTGINKRTPVIKSPVVKRTKRVMTAEDYLISKNRTAYTVPKRLGQCRVIPIKDKWYFLVHKTKYRSVRRFVDIYSSCPVNCTQHLSKLIGVHKKEFDKAKAACIKRKKIKWIFEESNLKKCAINAVHWNLCAARAGEAGAYKEFRDVMNSDSIRLMKKKVATDFQKKLAEERKTKIADQRRQWKESKQLREEMAAYRKEMLKSSEDQLHNTVDRVHDNTKLSQKQKDNLVEQAKWLIFEKHQFKNGLLKEECSLNFTPSIKNRMSKRMPGYGWEKLSLKQINGNTVKKLKSAGLLAQHRICVICRHRVLKFEVSDKDRTFTDSGCRNESCPVFKGTHKKTETQSPVIRPMVKAHSNSAEPYSGSLYGVDWKAGKVSNIVSGILVRHTGEGAVFEQNVLLPDIVSEHKFAPVNLSEPVDVAIGPGVIGRFKINGLGVVTTSSKEAVYPTFHCETTLVSGTPIFQKGKLVSVVTFSDGDSSYCIMNNAFNDSQDCLIEGIILDTPCTLRAPFDGNIGFFGWIAGVKINAMLGVRIHMHEEGDMMTGDWRVHTPAFSCAFNLGSLDVVKPLQIQALPNRAINVRIQGSKGWHLETKCGYTTMRKYFWFYAKEYLISGTPIIQNGMIISFITYSDGCGNYLLMQEFPTSTEVEETRVMPEVRFEMSKDTPHLIEFDKKSENFVTRAVIGDSNKYAMLRLYSGDKIVSSKKILGSNPTICNVPHCTKKRDNTQEVVSEAAKKLSEFSPRKMSDFCRMKSLGSIPRTPPNTPVRPVRTKIDHTYWLTKICPRAVGGFRTKCTLEGRTPNVVSYHKTPELISCMYDFVRTNEKSLTTVETPPGRRATQKKSSRRSIGKMILLLFCFVGQTSAGVKPMPSPATTSTSTVPTMTTTTTTLAPAPAELAYISGGSIPPLGQHWPKETVIYWNRLKFPTVHNTLDNLNVMLKSIEGIDTPMSVRYISEVRSGKLLEDPDRFKEAEANRLISFYDDVGTRKFAKVESLNTQESCRSFLSTVRGLKDKLIEIEKDCKILELLTGGWNYIFDQICHSEKLRHEAALKVTTDFIEQADKKLTSLAGDEEKLTEALEKYHAVLNEFKEFINIHSSSFKVPIFVRMKGNLHHIPVFTKEKLISENRYVREALHSIDKVREAVSGCYEAATSFMKTQEEINLSGDVKELWDKLISEPDSLTVGDETAYRYVQRVGGVVQSCYNIGEEQACVVDGGGIVPSPKNNAEIEKELAEFSPSTVVKNEPTPPEVPVKSEMEPAVKREVFWSDLKVIAKGIGTILVSLGFLEVGGTGMGLTALILITLTMIQACDPDLLMIQGSQEGTTNNWHAWGSMYKGQCIQFGDAIVHIHGVEMTQPIKFDFITVAEVRSTHRTKYGCPFGTEEQVCKDKLGCEEPRVDERKFCTHGYNGAFYKTECFMPGQLYTNVAVCLLPQGEEIHVYKLIETPKLTIRYEIFENGLSINGTFKQDTQILTGSRFQILNAGDRGRFKFAYVAAKGGDNVNKPKLYEIEQGVDVNSWCRTVDRQGLRVLADNNCMDIIVTQIGPDIEISIPTTRFVKELAKTNIKHIVSAAMRFDDKNKNLIREVNWFNGHFVFSAQPKVDHTEKCKLSTPPTVKITQVTSSTYKHNILDISVSGESKCKIKVVSQRCHIHGTQVMNVSSLGNARTVLICEFSSVDSLSIEGESTHSVELSGLAVEYNRRFHRIEDSIVRLFANGTIYNALVSVWNSIPNPIVNFLDTVKSWVVKAVVVVCGVVGILIGFQLSMVHKRTGMFSILFFAVLSAFLLTKANAEECNDLRDCIKQQAHKSPGFEPMVSSLLMSFLGYLSPPVIDGAFYMASAAILLQNIFEVALMVRNAQKIVRSIFDFLRSDYNKVAFICDTISSVSLCLMLWPVVGSLSVLLVMLAQRPLVIEAARNGAFYCRKLEDSYGSWFWSAAIANRWPKIRQTPVYQQMPSSSLGLTYDYPLTETNRIELHVDEQISGRLIVEQFYNNKNRGYRHNINVDNKCHINIIKGCIVATAHSLSDKEGWYVETDTAIYPEERAEEILHFFDFETADHSKFTIHEKGVLKASALYDRGYMVRTDREWRKGDSGFCFALGKRNNTKLWMHSGCSVLCRRVGIPSALAVEEVDMEYHSNTDKEMAVRTAQALHDIETDKLVKELVIGSMIFRPTKKNRGVGSAPSSPKTAGGTLAGEYSTGKTSEVAGSAPSRPKSAGGTTAARSSSSNRTRRNDSGPSSLVAVGKPSTDETLDFSTESRTGRSLIRSNQKTQRSRSMSASRTERRVSVDGLVAELTKIRVASKIIKGKKLIAHHGVVVQNLAPEYHEIDTPMQPLVVKEKTSPAFSKGSKLVAKKREVKQNLIPVELLKELKTVDPEFKLRYWTNTGISKESFEEYKKKGEVPLAASTANFLSETFYQYPVEKRRSLWAAASRYYSRSGVKAAMGGLDFLDFEKLAAVADKEQSGKVEKLTEKEAKLDGKMVQVNTTTYVTPTGKLSVRRTRTNKSARKVLTSYLETYCKNASGNIAVDDGSGQHICWVFVEGDNIAIPAHSAIVDTLGWCQFEDLLVNNPEFRWKFKLSHPAEGDNPEQDTVHTDLYNTDDGLRFVNSEGEVRNMITGESGKVFTCIEQSGSKYIMAVGDDDDSAEIFTALDDTVENALVETVGGVTVRLFPQDWDGQSPPSKIIGGIPTTEAEAGPSIQKLTLDVIDEESEDEVYIDDDVTAEAMEGERFKWELFTEQKEQVHEEQLQSLLEQLDQVFGDDTSQESLDVLAKYYAEAIIPELSALPNPGHPLKQATFYLIVSLGSEELFRKEYISDFVKKNSHNVLKRVYGKLQDKKAFCKKAHGRDYCAAFLPTLNGRRTCFQKCLASSSIHRLLVSNSTAAKNVMMWFFSTKYIIEDSLMECKWNSDFDKALHEILKNIATPEFINLFVWHYETSAVVPKAVVDNWENLQVTPETAAFIERFQGVITSGGSDVFDNKYPVIRPGISTKVLEDRFNSWVNNPNAVMLFHFRGVTRGWGFVNKSVLYSANHVLRGCSVTLTVNTDSAGRKLIRQGDYQHYSSTSTFEASETHPSLYGDLNVYGLPGVSTELERPHVGGIYLLINTELRAFCTMICTGSAASPVVQGQIGESRLVDHFAFVDLSKGKLDVISHTNTTKGWSGLPIMSLTGNPVGVFGYFRVLNSANAFGVTERAECTRPSVHTNLEDITSQSGEILLRATTAAKQQKWLRVSAPTGAGKSTKLVCAIGKLMYEKAKRNIKIVVCAPTVSIVNNLFDGLSSMISNDASCRGINIARKHGQLSVGQRLNSLSDLEAARAKITITYTTYGSYARTCKPEPTEDLLILDEIHDRCEDVITCEVILQEFGRWEGVFTMTATTWASAPGNDCYIDFSIGTSKRYPIDFKTIPKWDDIKAEEYNMHYPILGIEGKQVYALPRENCGENCKTIVFLSSINECRNGVNRLLEANSGVASMMLTSKNRDDKIPEGKVIIFATDVAESGITIPNCDNIVDFRRHIRPVTHLQIGGDNVGSCQWMYKLERTEISTCSAVQRQGRTGRTCAGTVWTCDSSPLPPMEDRPRSIIPGVMVNLMSCPNFMKHIVDTNRVAGTTMIRNEEIIGTIEQMDPKRLRFKTNFRPVLDVQTEGQLRMSRLHESDTGEVYLNKLKVLRYVKVLDPVAFYLMPNYPASWLENGRDAELVPLDTTAPDKVELARSIFRSCALEDSKWKLAMKESNMEFLIPLTDKLCTELWDSPDPAIREKYRDDAFRTSRFHSLESMWAGGGQMAMGIAATCLLFGQAYSVMYGSKTPSHIYLIEKTSIEKYMSCYEYLNREKLTAVNSNVITYWATKLFRVVRKSTTVALKTLPESNPLRKWSSKVFPEAKFQSGFGTEWEYVVQWLQKAWDAFNSCLPTERPELIQSWIGAGSIAGIGSFYDSIVDEFSPFGAFIIVVALGTFAFKVCCVPQLVGAGIIAGITYLIAHWWNTPETPSRFIREELNRSRKNRLFQMETGFVLGGLVERFIIPYFTKNSGYLVNTLQQVGSAAAVHGKTALASSTVALASVAGATKGAVGLTAAATVPVKPPSSWFPLVGTMYAPSGASKVYNMYLQLKMLWSGKTNFFSPDGVFAVLTSFEGATSILTLDYGALITLTTVAGVDALCEFNVDHVSKIWYRSYGTLKPGDTFAAEYLSGATAERESMIEKVKYVQALLHCVVGSGLNPINIIPALVATLCKKVYEADTDTAGLVETYQRAVTTHPILLLLKMMWVVWSKLKTVGDAEFHSEATMPVHLANIVERIKSTVSETVHAFWDVCVSLEGRTRAARKVFKKCIRLICSLVGWITSSIIRSISNFFKSAVDYAVREAVRQIVPTFWLKFCKKEKPKLVDYQPDYSMDLERFFHMYGLQSLMDRVNSVTSDEQFNDGICPWEIQSFQDLKLWRLLQKVVLSDDRRSLTSTLSGMRIVPTDVSGWYTTRQPTAVLKYMLSVVGCQLTRDVKSYVLPELDGEIINNLLRFHVYWFGTSVVSILYSLEQTSALVLVSDDKRGAFFSWKWTLPEGVNEQLQPYKSGFVEGQEHVVTAISACKPIANSYVLTNVKYPTLPPIDWDRLLHDIAFSQTSCVDCRALHAATCVTPLDNELYKLGDYSAQLRCVISHFRLEVGGCFKGLEKSLLWGTEIGKFFSIREVPYVHRDSGSVQVASSRLSHYGNTVGLASFASRMSSNDLSTEDLLSWAHCVTGLPAACQIPGKGGSTEKWLICDDMSPLKTGLPFVELCKWGCRLHNIKSSRPRFLKQINMAANSFRRYSNSKSGLSKWHSALEQTWREHDFIVNDKFSPSEVSYFGALLRDDKFTLDCTLLSRWQNVIGTRLIIDDKMLNSGSYPPGVISRKPLTVCIHGGKPEEISQVHLLHEGSSYYFSMELLTTPGVKVTAEVTEIVDVKLLPNEEFSSDKLFNLLVNGVASEGRHLVLNVKNRTYSRILPIYGKIFAELEGNCYPWVSLNMDPAEGICTKNIYLKRNPDWVFTALDDFQRGSESFASSQSYLFDAALTHYFMCIEKIIDGVVISNIIDCYREAVVDDSRHPGILYSIDVTGKKHYAPGAEKLRDFEANASALIGSAPSGLRDAGGHATNCHERQFLGELMASRLSRTRKLSGVSECEEVMSDTSETDGDDDDLETGTGQSTSVRTRVVGISREYALTVAKVLQSAVKISNQSRGLLPGFLSRKHSSFHSEGGFLQLLIDALNPETYKRLPQQAPLHERTGLRYLEALERHKRSLAPVGEGDTSLTLAETTLRESDIRDIMANREMPANEDLAKSVHSTPYLVHFDHVTKRSLPYLPIVGDTFCSVEASQDIQKLPSFREAERVNYRKSEFLPQGAPIIPLDRECKIPNNGTVSLKDCTAALSRVSHIKNPFWDIMASYCRVYKPKNSELGTASRGWPKCQAMDRDLGLWSSASCVFDMTSGFGGYCEYYTHCPPLVKIKDGKIVERRGRSRKLFFNSLILPGHATPIVDSISVPNPKISVRQFSTKSHTGVNGDIRDVRLLKLVEEVARTDPPELMVFDAGESSSNLEEEAGWQCKKLPMAGDLNDNCFVQTYGDAVAEYLKYVTDGGSAIIKMIGFSVEQVELTRAYSKGFTRIICYKNPLTPLPSREWYLVLLGRNKRLDSMHQYVSIDGQRFCGKMPVNIDPFQDHKCEFYYGRSQNQLTKDFDFVELIKNIRIEWLRAFNSFATWARDSFRLLKLEGERYGLDRELGSGQVICKDGSPLTDLQFDEHMRTMRERYPNISIDNAVKKLGMLRRFSVPRYYMSFLTPESFWSLTKPSLGKRVTESLLIQQKIASGSQDLEYGDFTVFGETFKSRINVRLQLLKQLALNEGFKLRNPSGIFKNVPEPFAINFKEKYGQEKHTTNMLLGDLAYYVFGLTPANSVIGHTQCTAEFLHAAWQKRLDKKCTEPSPGDAKLLYKGMQEIATPECIEIREGPDHLKFKPWTYEEACLEVNSQGKGGHFDHFLDFGKAIQSPEFKKAVLERLDALDNGMAVPTYQVCRDKRETKAKRNIEASGRLVLSEGLGETANPHSKAYKSLSKSERLKLDEMRVKELKDSASLGPRNIRFAEFVQRMADLMILGPVQKYHAHCKKLYYGSSTGTPLWRLGNLTKAMHDVYAPRNQQEFWSSSELDDHETGDSATYQQWFHDLMDGGNAFKSYTPGQENASDSCKKKERSASLRENVYLRMYDPSFRKGVERQAMAKIASGDFSGFDGTVSKTDLALNYFFYKAIYQKSYHKLLKTRWEHWMWALVITDHGNVIISEGQRSSGDQDTSFGNTMINSFYHFPATAISLGISIKEATTPIGEVWFKSDFKHNEPTFKKIYLHRITHIADGDDNLHFGTAQDIDLFDANGPAFLERCGKAIRCGTRSGYSLSSEYGGISYCSHSYVRVRIGRLPVKLDSGKRQVLDDGDAAHQQGASENFSDTHSLPLDDVARTLRRVDYGNLPEQHKWDQQHDLRVEYLPTRNLSEIVGKLVYTLKGNTARFTLDRSYGPGKTEVKRAAVNENAIGITRGKILSYLLNYAHIYSVRCLCFSALSIIEDGSVDLYDLKKRFHVPSVVSSIENAMRSVFNVGDIHEIETMSPTAERKGLEMLHYNTKLQFGSTKLRNVGETCPTTLIGLHDRCRAWIEHFSITHEVLPNWKYWESADPVFDKIRVFNSDCRQGERLVVRRKPKDRPSWENFNSNLYKVFLMVATLSFLQREDPIEDSMSRSVDLLKDRNEFESRDIVFHTSAERLPAYSRSLFPSIQGALRSFILQQGGPEKAVGKCLCLDTGMAQNVYICINRAKHRNVAQDFDIRNSLIDLGRVVRYSYDSDRKMYGRDFASRRNRLITIVSRGKIGGRNAAEYLVSAPHPAVRTAAVLPVK